MTQPDDFRAFLARQAEAEKALVLSGDLEPRLSLWTRRDPVSLLGAWGPNKSGWEEVSRILRWIAARIAQGTYSDYRYDVEIADVSGDMAYTVGFERFNSTADDGTVEPIVIRVTHIYRREDGDWKIVHRHADTAPIDESPPA